MSLPPVFGYGQGDQYRGGIAADQGSTDQGRIFLHWFLPGMSLQFAMMATAYSLRATGIVKPAMTVQVLTVLLNTASAPENSTGCGRLTIGAFC
ncbi:MAG: Multidrug export protein MepA [Pseudomonadota bacterium]